MRTWMLRAVLTMLALCVAGTNANQDAKPSFNCDHATTKVEETICTEPALAVLDSKLARVWQQVMASDYEGKTRLKKEQRRWLKNREQCLSADYVAQSCLAERYNDRIAELAALGSFDSADIVTGEPLKVLRVTPNGPDTNRGQQVVVTFDKPVVAIGEMAVDPDQVPVTITPAPACEWRWLNVSSLSCRLSHSERLKIATRYEVTVHAGIRTLNGEVLEKSHHSEFVTTLPKVNYVGMYSWFSPQRPIHVVRFNYPVAASEVEKYIYYQVEGDRIPVRVVPHILHYPVPADLALPHEAVAMAFRDEFRVEKKIRPLDADYFEKERASWLVIPQQELPKTILAQRDEEKIDKLWQARKRFGENSPKPYSLRVEPGFTTPGGSLPSQESRDILAFSALPPFRFLGIHCHVLGGKTYTYRLPIKQDELAHSCDPQSLVSLAFTVPLPVKSVIDGAIFSPDLKQGEEGADLWKNANHNYSSSATYLTGDSFTIQVPVELKAKTEYRLGWNPDKVTDIFGRSLVDTAPYFFSTSHRWPKFHPQYGIGVLEHGVDSNIGGWVTNISELTYRYKGWWAGTDGQEVSMVDGTSGFSGRTIKHTQVLPNVMDISFLEEMAYRDLFGGRSGVLSGRVDASASVFPSANIRKYDFFMQNTRFSAVAKIGYFRSMVWVTDMVTGEPVEGVEVSLRNFANGYDLANHAETKSIGLDSVHTDADGMALFSGPGATKDKTSAWRRVGVLVLKKGDQVAELPLDYNFKIGDGDYSKHSTHQYLEAWGFTTQGVYRLGDDVDFKLYLRDQDNKGLIDAEKFRVSLKVYGPNGDEVYSKNKVRLNSFGSLSGSVAIAKGNASGWYQAYANVDVDSHSYSFRVFRFLVTDFTPASFSVSSFLDSKLITPGKPVTHTTEARLLSGGPYQGGSVRLTGTLTPLQFVSANTGLKGYKFGNAVEMTEAQKFINSTFHLDDKGDYSHEINLVPSQIRYGYVSLESAVQDDRGKNIAASTSAIYAGTDRWVGIKPDRWYYRADEEASFNLMVVDASGDPLAGEAIKVSIQRQEAVTVKVKGPGNAYVSKQEWQWVDLAKCDLRSASTPVVCAFTPEEPGPIRVVAWVTDTHGQINSSSIDSWVSGSGYVSWGDDNTGSLAIIPESDEVNVGGTARYLVKNPYPGTKALITVERYGILDSWVEDFDGGLPVIEVPVKKEYSPGFYLSVTVFSPRVDKPIKFGRVDMGKPAQRIGVIKTRVTDPYFQTQVDISTDKAVYKPRETVKAKVKLSGRGLSFPHDNELAVVVIDEAVFQLNSSGRDYYDLYKGFYKLQSRGVGDYALLRRLIGRQNIEKKGANPGGDGGSEGGGNAQAEMRNLFKYIAYWNPSINVSGDEATFEFELPDNLTQFRIFVLAADKDKRLGLGDNTIKVNQPLEIKSATANQLTEGDRFTARFTVMNRTDVPQNVDVDVRVEGPVESGMLMSSMKLTLPPFKRVPIPVDIQTTSAGELKFEVRAANSEYADAMTHAIPVHQRSVLVTAANYGTTKKDSIAEQIHIPGNIYDGVGNINVSMTPTVLGNISGSLKYMDWYLYKSWEHQLSRALAAASYVKLKDRITDVSWPDALHLPQSILNSASNSQAPNGGMTFWNGQNDYVSPYLSAYTAHGFNELRSQGYDIPASVESKLHQYLLEFLRRDTYPDYYSRGMASTVRAVALNALVNAGKANRNDVKRFRSHLDYMTLFGKANFLHAALTVGDENAVKQSISSVLSLTDQTAGKFQFMEIIQDGYRHMLYTPMLANCSILSALVRVEAESLHGNMVADIPFKLVRMITQNRGNRDHWENTQENVFCTQALGHFADVYERDAPNFTAKVRLDSELMGKSSFKSFLDNPQNHRVPLKKGDAGRKAQLQIDKNGEGRLYYVTRLQYVEKEEHAKRINAGIEVVREYYVQRDGRWLQLESPIKLKRGELVRVELFVHLPAARYFVVVNDPVPGGLEPVNQDLATASKIDADEANWQRSSESCWYRYDDWQPYGYSRWSFYHQEIHHNAVHFFSDYLPQGNYHLSYTAQAIAEGEFSIMPLKVEEMYDPDVFGLGMPMTLEIR